MLLQLLPNMGRGLSCVNSIFKTPSKYVLFLRVNGHYVVSNGKRIIMFMFDYHSCHSSRTIFDNLSSAICVIAEPNYNVRHILHLLGDILTIDPPNVDADRTMTMIFRRLNIRIAKHNTMGILACIEYLGIILVTEKLEARLPQNKIDRICKFII